MSNINGLKLTLTLFRPHDPANKEDVTLSAAHTGSIIQAARLGGFYVMKSASDYGRVADERLTKAVQPIDFPPPPTELEGAPTEGARKLPTGPSPDDPDYHAEAAPSGDDFPGDTGAVEEG